MLGFPKLGGHISISPQGSFLGQDSLLEFLPLSLSWTFDLRAYFLISIIVLLSTIVAVTETYLKLLGKPMGFTEGCWVSWNSRTHLCLDSSTYWKQLFESHLKLCLSFISKFLNSVILEKTSLWSWPAWPERVSHVRMFQPLLPIKDKVGGRDSP